MPAATAASSNVLRDKLGVKAPEEFVDWFNLFVYGESGIGKTTLLGTCADHPLTHPMLLIDCEGGTKSIKGKKIDVVQVRTIKELTRIQNELYHDMGGESGEGGYYKTVGIDTLTELQQVDMRKIMREAKDKAQDPSKIDIEVPSPREWQKSLIHMTEIVRAFRDLPCHTFITAHLAEGEQEQDGSDIKIKKFEPALQGQSKKAVPGFMDIVGFYHFGRKGNEHVRRIQFEKTARVVAKDRTRTLIPFVDDPTIPEMWQRILTAQEAALA